MPQGHKVRVYGIILSTKFYTNKVRKKLKSQSYSKMNANVNFVLTFKK